MKKEKIVIVGKTIIPKDSHLTLRINKEIKSYLSQLAIERNVKVSTLIQSLAIRELKECGIQISVNLENA